MAPADFSGAPLSGTVPLEVTFTDASSGTIDGWSWDFGDGVTSTATNPTHVYTRTGVYTVSLAVSGPCGSDALTRTNYVTVGSRVYVTTTRVITYIYDPLSRLISATYSTGEQFGYGYDAVRPWRSRGNRTAYTATAPLAGTSVATYTFGAANRLLVSQSPGHLVTYAWDAWGNLVSDSTFTYTHNAAGRMVRAYSLTSTVVYTYNVAGLRVAQSVDGDVTTFAWDWASGIPEMLSDGQAMGSSIALYLVGHETLGRWDGADWTYYLPDALGSIRQETDGTGAVTGSREWTPFGVEVGTAQEGLGFAGEWYGGNAELLYLRARWYAVEVGRFTSPDPVIADFHDPRSINRYVYVLGNPVNAVDPRGLYHSDVHFDLTRDLALRTAKLYFPADVAEKLADCIAGGDQHVDDPGPLMALPQVGCMECHFCPLMPTISHVKKGIASGDPFLFGATLHQFQDFYAHWNEGYDAISGHGGDSYRAGVNIFRKPRSPGGKSARSGYVLDDFFEGGHYQPGLEDWLQSRYPAHSREDVIAEIRRLNPAIDLNGLHSDDLIDLYLRRERHQDPGWQQRVQERDHFGIDPDAYIPSSTRDTYMRQSSGVQIRLFIQRFAGNVCGIDWGQCEDADDSAIEALLTE